MPKYTFSCQNSQCGVRFSRTLKMDTWPTHKCPSCKEEAPRLFEDGFAFAFQAGKGSAQANTGVHDQDYPSADKIVGRSAETRWGTFRERQKVKDEVRKMGGPALVRTDGAGYVEYDAMSDASLKARAKTVDYAVALERANSASKPSSSNR